MSQHTSGPWEHTDELAANARLIAQAPAMLEALRKIEPWLTKVTDVHPSAREAQTACRAILRAVGGDEHA